MLHRLLQKTIITTAALNAPLLFRRLYGLNWYRGTLLEWVDTLDLPDGAKILELGCGPGDFSAELAKLKYQVIGSDKSERMIQWASKITTDARFVQADALDLPMVDNEFDIVLLALSSPT